MTLSYSKTETLPQRWQRRGRWLLIVVGVLGRIVLGAMFLGGTFMATSFLGGAPLFPYFLVIGLALLVTWALGRRGLHRRRVAGVFAYCARGMDAGLALPGFLRTAAKGERGVMGRRLRSVAVAMESGYPLARALCEALPELDYRQAAMLVGSMPAQSTREVMDRLRREHAASETDPIQSPATQAGYWAVIFVTVALVSARVIIYVLPRFKQILRDFEIPAVSYPVEMLWPVYFVAAGVGISIVMWLIFSSVAELTNFRGTANRGRSWPAWVPLLGDMAWNRQLADLYNTLADAVEAGVAVEQMEGEGKGTSMVASAFLASLAGGLSLEQAGRLVRLPEGDVALLATAGSGKTLGPALRLLAIHRQRRRDATRQVIGGIVTFALIAITAAMVISLVYSTWKPMTLLLEHAVAQATRRMH